MCTLVSALIQITNSHLTLRRESSPVLAHAKDMSSKLDAVDEASMEGHIGNRVVHKLGKRDAQTYLVQGPHFMMSCIEYVCRS